MGRHGFIPSRAPRTRATARPVKGIHVNEIHVNEPLREWTVPCGDENLDGRAWVPAVTLPPPRNKLLSRKRQIRMKSNNTCENHLKYPPLSSIELPVNSIELHVPPSFHHCFHAVIVIVETCREALSNRESRNRRAQL